MLKPMCALSSTTDDESRGCGGKELVRKYLLLTQEQVIKSKSSLETIVGLLKI